MLQSTLESSIYPSTYGQSVEAKWRFTHLPAPKLPGFLDKTTQEFLYKWGMKESFYIEKFTYDSFLADWEVDAFADAFFADPQVTCNLRVLSSLGSWGRMPLPSSVVSGEFEGSKPLSALKKEALAHTVTSLSFFDKIAENGITRKDGEIKKCLDEYVGGFLVADELRRAIIMEDDEKFCTFSESDRQEFIFHLFKSLALGGGVCQYEDTIDAYLDITRKLYKDLICVKKDASSGKLVVASHVFKITSIPENKTATPLFPVQHPQNFAFLSIDPIKRNVFFIYHACTSYY